MTSYTKVNTVCIKGVRTSDWSRFKAEAARANKTMGDFFNVMLSTYTRSPKGSWDVILKSKPTLTKKEADEIMKEINEVFRTEKGFR